MKYKVLDREQLAVCKLGERTNKVIFDRDKVSLLQQPENISEAANRLIEQTAERIRVAREKKSAVILSFGAHTIKNCMAPTLIELMRGGRVTHLANNGAGIIHDWETASLTNIFMLLWKVQAFITGAKRHRKKSSLMR